MRYAMLIAALVAVAGPANRGFLNSPAAGPTLGNRPGGPTLGDPVTGPTSSPPVTPPSMPPAPSPPPISPPPAGTGNVAARQAVTPPSESVPAYIIDLALTAILGGSMRKMTLVLVALLLSGCEAAVTGTTDDGEIFTGTTTRDGLLRCAGHAAFDQQPRPGLCWAICVSTGWTRQRHGGLELAATVI